MERKKKVCRGTGKHSGLGCGKTVYLFSHGLCPECTNRAKISTKTTLLTVDRDKVKKSLKSKPMKVTGEKKVFEEIWGERPHVSQVSGKPLLPEYHKLWHWQFAHCRSKGADSSNRLNKDNILLMTWDEHHAWDNARHTLKNKPEWEWVFDKYENIKLSKFKGEGHEPE